MELNIVFRLKFDTEAEADTAVTYINTNYSTYVIKGPLKVDMTEQKAEGVFPTDWAVYCRLQFTGAQFLELRNHINDIIDNHASKIFNLTACTSHELEP